MFQYFLLLLLCLCLQITPQAKATGINFYSVEFTLFFTQLKVIEENRFSLRHSKKQTKTFCYYFHHSLNLVLFRYYTNFVYSVIKCPIYFGVWFSVSISLYQCLSVFSDSTVFDISPHKNSITNLQRETKPQIKYKHPILTHIHTGRVKQRSRQICRYRKRTLLPQNAAAGQPDRSPQPTAPAADRLRQLLTNGAATCAHEPHRRGWRLPQPSGVAQRPNARAQRWVIWQFVIKN